MSFRDATSTTVFMIGAVLGEAGLPMITGVVIDKIGFLGLPYAVVLSACVLVVLYYAIHVTGTAPSPIAIISRSPSSEGSISIELTRRRQLVI